MTPKRTGRSPTRKAPTGRKATRAAPRGRPAARSAASPKARKTPAKRPAAKPAAPVATISPPSKAFYQYQKEAEVLAQDAKKCRALAELARQEMTDLGSQRGPLSTHWEDLNAMVDLLELHAEGRTPNVAWNTIVLSAAALHYLTKAGDLVPDWLPEGRSDDAAVIGMVSAIVQDDLAAFRQRSPSGRR